MFKEIDIRGMTYPIAINYTKQALLDLKEGGLTAIVDNKTIKDDISQFAKKMDLKVDIQENRGDYHIDIFKEGSIKEMTFIDTQYDNNKNKDLTILITKDYLGEGCKELGKILIGRYINALSEIYPFPSTIIFINSGINLTVKGSNIIESLIKLEKRDVEIITCAYSLDYFQIRDKPIVGNLGSMYKIVEKLNYAKNTITI